MSHAIWCTCVRFAIPIVTLLISAICMILVLVNAGQRDQTVTEQSPDLCIACLLLQNETSAFFMATIKRKKSGNQEICCAETSAQASEIVNMIMSPKEETEQLTTLNAGNFSLGQASAHKYLSSNLIGKGEPEFLKDNMILEFESTEHPLIEHVRNIEVMKTGMVVQLPGMYFVYSSILFRPDSAKPCKDLEKQIWDHNIVLSRSSDKTKSGVILNTTYTCCDDCIGSRETSYAGGLFLLQENDHLHVEVTSDGIVSFTKEGSYFGLFMLN